MNGGKTMSAALLTAPVIMARSNAVSTQKETLQ